MYIAFNNTYVCIPLIQGDYKWGVEGRAEEQRREN
jgi:hypothetical protein